MTSRPAGVQPHRAQPAAHPLRALPARVHRRYLTIPLEYATGFALLMLLLPGPWKLLAAVPLPLG